MPDKKTNTQKDLAEIISSASDISLGKKQLEKIIKLVFDAIIGELKANRSVKITSFGTFSPKNRYARGGVNPRNPQERIKIPAVRVAKFKTGKKLKDALKK